MNKSNKSFSCVKSVDIRRELVKNNKNIHEKKRFKCEFEGCEKAYSSQSAKKLHFEEVHLQKNRKNLLCCDLCEYKHREKTVLKSHMFTKHLNLRPFKCKLCEKCYADIKSLKDHKKLKHGPNGPLKFECNICGIKIASKFGLRSHKKTHIDFQCDSCDRIFKTQLKLKIHLKLDHLIEVEEFECNLCSKKFVTKKRMLVHKKNNHNKTVKCKLEGCEQVFKMKYLMIQHYKKIHLDIDEKVIFSTIYKKSSLSKYF
jgi:uncharacterized Zn-finger protein